MSMTNGHTHIPPGVSLEIAVQRNYRRVESERQLAAYDHQFTERQQQIPGLLIPVYQLGNAIPHTHVLRPDKPRMGYDGKMVKYEWPERVPLVLDVLPCYREALSDPSIPIYITEGAKKADALASVLGTKGVPININGVWGWKHKTHDGASHPLEDFGGITWKNREVILAFDNDVTRKPEVQQALRALAKYLKGRGALVRVLVLPDDGEKVGVDDALAGGMTLDELQGYICDLDELPRPAEIAIPARRYLTEDEIDLLKPPTWLIKNVVPVGEVTMVIGAGDAGKTFIVVDMVKRVAQHYPVMYIAAEDASGIRVRKRAWELHHQCPKNGKFHMWNGVLPIFEEREVAAFINEVQALDLKMIVVDTLSQSIAGADENSAKDMTIVMQHCQWIARETGAAVVVIHHTTKGGETYRGSSALKNNTYGFLEVSKEDDLVKLECGRIKNTRPFAPRFFSLTQVDTDIADEEGQPIQSCVILPAERVFRGSQLNSSEIKMLKVLLDMTDADDGAKTRDLDRALGLPSASFYRSLKRLRNMNLVDKGEKQTSPLNITGAGRLRLAEESNDPQYQEPGSPSVVSPGFEVNTKLLSLLSDSSLVDSSPDSSPESSENGQTTITQNDALQSEIITTIKLLSDTLDSNGQTTIYHSPPLKGESSDRSSPESKPMSDVDHDRRRASEVREALANGDIQAARKAASRIRGRKDQAMLEIEIDQVVEAGALP